MHVNRNQVMEAFIRIIDHISDKTYQTRVWITRKGPECQAFDDMVCDFFDIGDPILEEYQEYGLSKSQYQILKNFRDEFEEFSDENDWPPEFIDTPEWARITEMAKEVLKAFNKRIRK